ncbi:MAG: MATE family efflux transporter [Treponema sp.]|nr:MATE family efflux transporter [Treponema sp.]
MTTQELFGTQRISRILLKLAPPVMFSQLIQALYNIVDSFFIGRSGETGLTALSIIYPVQLLMIALAVGTGVGINTAMAMKLGRGRLSESKKCAGMATLLAVVLWVVFAVVGYCFMPAYARLGTSSPEVISDVIVYGRIVCVFSFGLFLESGWTKVLQSEGNMALPMLAQIVGAAVNIALDPLLIFGLAFFPKLGIEGAAYATVIGQIAAALVVMKRGARKPPRLRFFAAYTTLIFKLGIPNMLMQSAYTFYILGLNLILKSFSDQAVTALGLYYKWQTFFFIPLGSMQTCVVPVISYNYGSGKLDRCRKTVRESILFGMALMFFGTLCFEFIAEPMFRVFTKDSEVIRIGVWGFKFIGVSFIPMVTSLMFPVVFQSLGFALKSSFLTIFRTVILFVPLGFLFSHLGLPYFWLTFPITETLTTLAGILFYVRWVKKDSNR